ncbi:substrate-binding domain-containing protein [Streptomyces adelaidensis]|uniref:substrate-binding domain-containing protein n=1 Tax=Streptomyces adelaidensis TaxID=2796465 RepID=UPI0027DB584C|nr:substrate-binding domain-containing protein [Streptomyces adelaidensis]
MRTGLVQLPESTPSGARIVVDQALSGAERPDGLIVPHTSAIPHVLGALLQRGMVPGRDISVVGHCTDSAAEAMEPAVTNVSHAPREISVARCAPCSPYSTTKAGPRRRTASSWSLPG